MIKTMEHCLSFLFYSFKTPNHFSNVGIKMLKEVSHIKRFRL